MLYTTRNPQVMKQYQLGPNGGIMTALNLFATKFDQVRSRTRFFNAEFDQIGSSSNPASGGAVEFDPN